MNRRNFFRISTSCIATLIIPASAEARAYGVNGYATKRNREYNRQINQKYEIQYKGYKAFEAGETVNPWIIQDNVRWEPYASYWDTGWIAARDFNSLPKEEQERILAERQAEIDAYLKEREERQKLYEQEQKDRRFRENLLFGSIIGGFSILAFGAIASIMYDEMKNRK